jgi:hypothetical protein
MSLLIRALCRKAKLRIIKMKTKLTARHLVRALYLEAEEHRLNLQQRTLYFVEGYIQAIKEGIDQLEYWRSVLIIYPDMIDKIYENLSNRDIDRRVKDFLEKMVLLK